MPKLLKVSRNESSVTYRQEFAGDEVVFREGTENERHMQGTEERTTVAHEAPLAAFDKALQALKNVALNVLELERTNTKAITVSGFALSYTKDGVRSIQVFFTKKLGTLDGEEHPLKTPMFQFDDGASGRRVCSAKHAEEIEEAIKEANRYAAGHRQQKLLKFEPEKENPEEQDPNQGALIPLGAAAR